MFFSHTRPAPLSQLPFSSTSTSFVADPQCRNIAIPDLRFVPKKYHSLTSGVRRVFISTDADGTRVHPDDAGLRAQIASLIEKVSGLERDKMLLMDRCEAAIRASHAHAQGERDERLEKDRLERENRELNRKHQIEMRELRKKYECVKGKYKALKAVYVPLLPFLLSCIPILPRILTPPPPRAVQQTREHRS